MGGISRFENRDSVPERASGSGAPAVGAGRSVDRGQWDGSVLTFEELIGHPAPESAIASMARLIPGARRRGSPPMYYRRRVGWAAERNRIVTAASEQHLTPLPDGRFKAVGAWSPARFLELTVSGMPTRRVGDVPDDRSFGPDRGSSHSVKASKFADAEAQAAYLPTPVRRSIAARVPDPLYFEAEAVRYTGTGTLRHTVRVLKAGSRDAIVVIASRQSGAPTWQVEQVVYQLVPRRVELST